MITVRLPATLRTGPADTIEISEPLQTIDELVDALERHIPGLRDQLDDSVFNFAINDVLVLYHARRHPLADGDRVEIIPTISGG